MSKKYFLSILVSLLLVGQAFAEGEHEKVMYLSSTGKLIIPQIHVMDKSGSMKSMVSAKLVLINDTEPYEFRLVDLGVVADDPENVDAFGCVLPETWHAEMGHCMVQ